jgi:hypothetical protein
MGEQAMVRTTWHSRHNTSSQHSTMLVVPTVFGTMLNSIR